LHLNGSTNPTIIGFVPPPRASKEVTFDPEVVKEVKSKYFSLFSKYYDTAAMEEYVGNIKELSRGILLILVAKILKSVLDE